MTTAGYTVDRNATGLTAREREMVLCLMDGMNQSRSAERMGVSRQRTGQLMKSLKDKKIVKSNADGSMTVSFKVKVWEW